MPAEKEDYRPLTDDAAIEESVWVHYGGEERKTCNVYFDHPLAESLIRRKVSSQPPAEKFPHANWDKIMPDDLAGFDPSQEGLSAEVRARLTLAHGKHEGFGRWTNDDNPQANAQINT